MQYLRFEHVACDSKRLKLNCQSVTFNIDSRVLPCSKSARPSSSDILPLHLLLPALIIFRIDLTREVNSTMMALTAAQRRGEGVAHALAVVKAYNLGDYCSFFRLYVDAPNMTG